MPTTSKLTPVLQERQFWAAFLVGFPLLLFGYFEVFDALVHGAKLDVAGTIAAFTANPIVLYLAARQYPRGKAVEAHGVEAATLPGAADPLDVDVTLEDVEHAQRLHGEEVDVPAGVSHASDAILPNDGDQA